MTVARAAAGCVGAGTVGVMSFSSVLQEAERNVRHWAIVYAEQNQAGVRKWRLQASRAYVSSLRHRCTEHCHWPNVEVRMAISLAR